MKRIASILALSLLLVTPAFADGIDSYAKLVLHLDGTDASTTITDSSLSPKTMTANGDMQIDTAQSVFGGASGLFDGTGDFISGISDADYDITNGLFTVDFRLRWNSVATAVLFQFGNGGSTDGAWGVYWAANTLNLYYYTTDSPLSPTVVYTAAWTPSVNTWYHVAVVRGWGGNANDFAFTVDGVQVGTTGTSAATFTTPTSGNDTVRIGCQLFVLLNQNYLNGWIDEYRYSKGISRWTANFTPPAQAYSADSPAATFKSRAFVI